MPRHCRHATAIGFGAPIPPRRADSTMNPMNVAILWLHLPSPPNWIPTKTGNRARKLTCRRHWLTAHSNCSVRSTCRSWFQVTCWTMAPMRGSIERVAGRYRRPRSCGACGGHNKTRFGIASRSSGVSRGSSDGNGATLRAKRKRREMKPLAPARRLTWTSINSGIL